MGSNSSQPITFPRPLEHEKSESHDFSQTTWKSAPNDPESLSEEEKTIKFREWESTNPSNSQSTVKIMSYNILADCYSSYQDYCPSWALVWKYRHPLLIQEIAHYQPDVICIQEMDRFDHFSELLQKQNFTGIFQKRDSIQRDGCAIYYKNDRFECLQTESIHFNLILKEWKEAFNFDPRKYATNNIGLIALMLDKKSQKSFIIATTHLYWNPKMTNLKILQMAFFIEKIEKFIENQKVKKIPLILCGDLNSLPQSAVLDLILKGSVSKSHPEIIEFLPNFDRKHRFKFASGYDSLKPPITNFTPKFSGCLDWIFFTESDWNLLNRLHSDQVFTGIPDATHPSDHIPIAIELDFKDSENK